MLEWVCPKCRRSVDPGFEECPFCREAEATAASAPGPSVGGRPVHRVRKLFDWSDVERGFRFGLGFVAAVLCAYFILFLIAFSLEDQEWVQTLGRWLYGH